MTTLQQGLEERQCTQPFLIVDVRKYDDPYIDSHPLNHATVNNDSFQTRLIVFRY